LISELNNKIENALFEAENAEEQIRDKSFSTLEADYKIAGKLTAKSFVSFNKEIIESYLKGNWDFERDILKVLKNHFPEIQLKKDGY
jgi:hypothetical protein